MGPIDASRVRSFIGLSIGLVGPRANLAISGVIITLFVQQRASGALAVTFALTADRLVSWLTFPVAGRLSDRTRSRVGRRTPYMAGSLIVMGVATWMFTVVNGYWPLVLMILIAGQASATFTLTNVAVVPEVFGRSRWIKALLLTTVLGTIASWTIKGTVIASWKQNDPSTWNLPFQVAAVILVVVGIVVLLLVREAPTASYGAEADRSVRARPTLDELRDIMSGPNAKVLVGGSLLFWSGVGSTAYVAILFFQRVLHAGASAQTVAGLVTGIPVFFIGIALGIPLSRKLSPMQLAVGAPLIGAVLAGVQYFDTHLWQAVVLGYIGAPFIGAYIIVMAPLLLQLLPRAGGLGERLGVLLAPFNLCSVLLAYIAAIVIDATGNYRLIWLFPAATGLAHATVNCWLKYPTRRATTPDMVGRLWEWSVVQAESMAEMGLVTGLLAAPVLGRRIGPLGHRCPPGRWRPRGRPGERGPEVRAGRLVDGRGRWVGARRLGRIVPQWPSRCVVGGGRVHRSRNRSGLHLRTERRCGVDHAADRFDASRGGIEESGTRTTGRGSRHGHGRRHGRCRRRGHGGRSGLRLPGGTAAPPSTSPADGLRLPQFRIADGSVSGYRPVRDPLSGCRLDGCRPDG
jgi:Na+/melibiose symporter-like transporter